MKFARIVFAAADLSGIATLLPMYLLPSGASFFLAPRSNAEASP